MTEFNEKGEFLSAGKECSDHRHSDMEKDSSHGYIMKLTPIGQALSTCSNTLLPI